MIAPCLNCTKRTISCHSKCQDYIDFRKAKDELNAKINKDKELISAHYELAGKKFKRLNKR